MPENKDFWGVPPLAENDGADKAFRLSRCIAYLKNAIHEVHAVKSCLDDEFSDEFLSMDSLSVELSKYIRPIEHALKVWSK